MYRITIVWTCVILSVHRAECGKYITIQSWINVAGEALPEHVKTNFAQAKEKYKADAAAVSLAQSIANRLINKTERKWENCKENGDVEVHIVFGLTFVIFKPETFQPEKKEGKNSVNQCLEKFFSVEKKKRMEEKLEKINVGTDRHVLEIGTGVRIKKSSKWWQSYSNVDVHVCFVLFTTDELLPRILQSIPTKHRFHAKTTLYAAEYSLRKQYDKNVLYEHHWSYRLRMSKKSLEYIIINKESDNPSIKRADGNPIGGKDNVGLSQIEWNKLIYGKNKDCLSHGFGAWTVKGKDYIFIVTHSPPATLVPILFATTRPPEFIPQRTKTPGPALLSTNLMPTAQPTARHSLGSESTEGDEEPREETVPLHSEPSPPLPGEITADQIITKPVAPLPLSGKGTGATNESLHKFEPETPPENPTGQTTEIPPAPENSEEDEEDSPNNVSTPVEDPEGEGVGKQEIPMSASEIQPLLFGLPVTVTPSPEPPKPAVEAPQVAMARNSDAIVLADDEEKLATTSPPEDASERVSPKPHIFFNPQVPLHSRSSNGTPPTPVDPKTVDEANLNQEKSPLASENINETNGGVVPPEGTNSNPGSSSLSSGTTSEVSGAKDKGEEKTEKMQPEPPVPKETPAGTDSVPLEQSGASSILGSL